MRMRILEALGAAAVACVPMVSARAQPADAGTQPAIAYVARLLPMNPV